MDFHRLLMNFHQLFLKPNLGKIYITATNLPEKNPSPLLCENVWWQTHIPVLQEAFDDRMVVDGHLLRLQHQVEHQVRAVTGQTQSQSGDTWKQNTFTSGMIRISTLGPQGETVVTQHELCPRWRYGTPVCRTPGQCERGSRYSHILPLLIFYK